MDAVPLIPDFDLIRQIGGGSYGDVWLGRSVTGVYRAIKIVNRARFEDSRPFLREFEGIKRFQNAVGTQARQLALLHVGYDEQAGTLYYVMELADDATSGTDIDPATYVPLTLKELHRRQVSALPLTECIRIGAELAGALAGLHEAGLIHRDVKPSNIIFVNGVPKLADVGLIASTEQTLTSLGTAGYAPPEGGGTVRADIYSLGKILYELATGLGPGDFPRIPMAVIVQHGSGPIFELNEVILRACDPNPSERYASTRAMLDELRLLQAGRSVKELNSTKRRLRFLRQIGGVLLAVALVALTALAANNYRVVRRVAIQEAAFRKLAEANQRFAQYTADLHLARIALSGGDYGATRHALRRHIPLKGGEDLRGFEWHALWKETAGDSSATFGTIGDPGISALALSPDGNQLAAQVGTRSHDITLWNIKTGDRRLIKSDSMGLGGFSSDGEKLTVGTPGRMVFELDLRTEKRLADQPVSGRLVLGLDDGHTLLLTQPRPDIYRFIVWDTERRQQVAEWQPEAGPYKKALAAATLSKDGRLVGAANFWTEGAAPQRDLAVYDLLEKKLIFRIGHVDGVVQALCFSPDNQTLAVAGIGKPITIYSLTTGDEISRLSGHNGGVHAVEYSPNGRMLASVGSDQTVRIWKIDTKDPPLVMHGHESDVATLRWLPDSSGLITGGMDGTCRIWRLKAPPSTKITGLWSDLLGDFLFSPDGQKIVATSDTGQLAVFDASTLVRGRLVAGVFQPLLFEDASTSLLALSSDKRLVRVNLHEGSVAPLAPAVVSSQRIAAIEVSAQHRMAAIGLNQGWLEIWDLAQAKTLGAKQVLSQRILGLGWKLRAGELAIGDESGRMEIVSADLKTREVLPTQASSISAIAYSPDGKWMALGRYDGQVVLKDCSSGETLPLLGHSSIVTSLVFSPDGSRLVTGGYEGLIIFWGLSPLRQIAVWTWDDDLHAGTQHGIYRLKFDTLGKRLGALTEDGRLRIWSTQP